MKERLKLIGWVILFGLTAMLYMIFGISLAPIWGLLWLFTGWSFYTTIYNWVENTFPIEFTS